MSYELSNKYYPYYRATPDYAYETELKAAAVAARLATQKADYARVLHKDLDERTRNIERDVKALEQRVTALEPKKVMIDESLFLVQQFTPIFTDPAQALRLLDSITANLDFMFKEGKSNGRVTWLACAPQHITRLKRMAQGTQDNAFVKDEITLLRADINEITRGHEDFYCVTIPRTYDALAQLEALIPAPKPAEPTKTDLIAKYTKQLEDTQRARRVYGLSDPASTKLMVEWFLKILKEINRAP